jgi:LPS-assembly lipoprotein|tara:strand:+ start:71 stop:571 length:501 start_codon:yes stop_codon:yes gene_type:complete
MKYRGLLLIITLIISGCGWQLRDSQIAASSIGAVYLSSSDTNSVLTKELRRALSTYGVHSGVTKAESKYVVVIVDFRQNTRIASINSSGRVAEYQLNEDVDFYITDAEDNQVLSLSTASVERVYEFREEDILASSNEEQRILTEMRSEIVRQILNRLRALPMPIDA